MKVALELQHFEKQEMRHGSKLYIPLWKSDLPWIKLMSDQFNTNNPYKINQVLKGGIALYKNCEQVQRNHLPTKMFFEINLKNRNQD